MHGEYGKEEKQEETHSGPTRLSFLSRQSHYQTEKRPAFQVTLQALSKGKEPEERPEFECSEGVAPLTLLGGGIPVMLA